MGPVVNQKHISIVIVPKCVWMDFSICHMPCHVNLDSNEKAGWREQQIFGKVKMENKMFDLDKGIIDQKPYIWFLLNAYLSTI